MKKLMLLAICFAFPAFGGGTTLQDCMEEQENFIKDLEKREQYCNCVIESFGQNAEYNYDYVNDEKNARDSCLKD